MARFRSYYDLGEFPKPVVDCSVEPSKAKQSFAAECDINNIMSRYERDGLLVHTNQYEGKYADVTDGVDYHSAMNVVTKANEMFMTLPASVRTRFGNDPGMFLEFVNDPANADEMVKLGLRTAPVEAPAGAAPASGAADAGANKPPVVPDKAS